MTTSFKGGPASETIAEGDRPVSRWARSVLDKAVQFRDENLAKLDEKLDPHSAESTRALIGGIAMFAGGFAGKLVMTTVLPVDIAVGASDFLVHTAEIAGALGAVRATLPNALISHLTDDVAHGLGTLVDKARAKLSHGPKAGL